MSEDKIVNNKQELQQQQQSATGSAMVGLNLISGGSTFHQRRLDLYNQLKFSVEQCCMTFDGRRELASERDSVVADLCEALEEAFNYGLRQEATVVHTAVSLLHNMTEIIKGAGGGGSGGTTTNGSNANDITFWDFCQTHLTKHERERFESLKHVWTKYGRGRAFIRTTLNENSLQRYILTWLSDDEALRRYYTPWSLLLDAEISEQLPKLIGLLDKIVFALKCDTIEMNAPARNVPPTREEPIIYAPAPQPKITTSASTKSKRKVIAVERPIISTEDVITALQNANISTAAAAVAAATVATPRPSAESYGGVEVAEEIVYNSFRPDLTLEYLKQPLDDFQPENHEVALLTANAATDDSVASDVSHFTALNGDSVLSDAIGDTNVEVLAVVGEDGEEVDEDALSQYSKSSSTTGVVNMNSVSATNNNSNKCIALEQQLRDMSEKYVLLQTKVAQLTRENRQLVRRLTQLFNESGIDPSSSLATNFLITIPYVQLLNAKRSNAYYVYEVHITMRQNLEHWTVLRRYREFYKLHKSLQKTHPHIANAIEFPPKKHFGNMNQTFVDERRQQLQIYLLNVVEALPQVEACKTRGDLQKQFPFLRER